MKVKKNNEDLSLNKKKRLKNELSIERKREICVYFLSNPKIKQVNLRFKFSKQFGYNIPKSTLSEILNKADYWANCESSNSYRVRGSKYPELEESLLIWFCEMRSRGIMLSDQMLKTKAEYYGTLLGISGFLYSDGCLILIKHTYDDMGPNKTLATKAESGQKRDKTRVTIGCCCNSTGTEKIKPIVIGGSRKPRCFNNFNPELFVYYRYIKFKNPERKVCLIVDNSSSHKHVELSNVVVKFFAPNMTSSLQPCDAGIIYSFKSNYKKNLVKFLLEKIEDFNEFKLPELNDAIRMIRKAWNDVLVTTIVRCWDHCDILSTKNKPLESSDYLDKSAIESQCNLNLDELIDRFKTKYFEYNKDCSDKFDSAAE
ncbi:unnamed protein product, partial [Brachionus calyciflorus]